MIDDSAERVTVTVMLLMMMLVVADAASARLVSPC